MLQEHLLTDLKVPQSYEVRLTPITRFGTGDAATRIIHYREPISYPNPLVIERRFKLDGIQICPTPSPIPNDPELVLTFLEPSNQRSKRWLKFQNNTCHFEDEKICGYTQDTTDNFDWLRQSGLTHDPKRSANTGPTTDLSGTPEGYYMFIEASAPRVKDDKARLISPMYNMTARFCVSFYYHMYGRHIGE
ncbi:hypothetical protein lerEdw1_018823 [Lerista edwardsae]|nr:hypothetical protein lerEdw1_018823 [Lerista edwardsae]